MPCGAVSRWLAGELESAKVVAARPAEAPVGPAPPIPSRASGVGRQQPEGVEPLHPQETSTPQGPKSGGARLQALPGIHNTNSSIPLPTQHQLRPGNTIAGQWMLPALIGASPLPENRHSFATTAQRAPCARGRVSCVLACIDSSFFPRQPLTGPAVQFPRAGGGVCLPISNPITRTQHPGNGSDAHCRACSRKGSKGRDQAAFPSFCCRCALFPGLSVSSRDLECGVRGGGARVSAARNPPQIVCIGWYWHLQRAIPWGCLADSCGHDPADDRSPVVFPASKVPWLSSCAIQQRFALRPAAIMRKHRPVAARIALVAPDPVRQPLFPGSFSLSPAASMLDSLVVGAGDWQHPAGCSHAAKRLRTLRRSARLGQSDLQLRQRQHSPERE